MSAANTLHATSQADDTVWKERDPLIDRIPRPLAIAGLVLGVIGLWGLVTGLEIVSPIILPGPAETGSDLVFVGTNLVLRRIRPQCVHHHHVDRGLCVPDGDRDRLRSRNGGR